jgi:excisionase family DNA binding protein
VDSQSELQDPSEWPAKADPNLMTVEDVARRLNTSESFVYGAIADGRLKHHRLGKGQGAIRVSEAQLSAFLFDTERGGMPPPTPPAPAKKAFRHLPRPS